jgi:hypothetical protein
MPKIRRSKELAGAITCFVTALLIGGGMLASAGLAVQDYLTAQAALKIQPAQENIRFHKASIIKTNNGTFSEYYQFKGGRHLVADTTYAVPVDEITQEQARELAEKAVTVSIAHKDFGISGSADRWLLGIEAEGKQYLNPTKSGEMYVNEKRKTLYWVWIIAALGLLIICAGGKILIFHFTPRS